MATALRSLGAYDVLRPGSKNTLRPQSKRQRGVGGVSGELGVHAGCVLQVF